jgi:hypothetical protein
MPDQELLDDFLEALEQSGSPVKNPVLRQRLGWDEATYVAATAEPKDKSLESWIWDAACSIRGAKDAAKYKHYILPLIFTKRLCGVFDDELNRIAEQVGSRAKAFQLVALDHKLVRFYLPLKPEDPQQPVWSVIRQLADKIGEGVTSQLPAIARENPSLQGISRPLGLRDRARTPAPQRAQPRQTLEKPDARPSRRLGTRRRQAPGLRLAPGRRVHVSLPVKGKVRAYGRSASSVATSSAKRGRLAATGATQRSCSAFSDGRRTSRVGSLRSSNSPSKQPKARTSSASNGLAPPLV